MEILRPGFDLERFFASVGKAGSRALLLDYDGTLAPFREERSLAAPYPGVAALLGRLLAAGRTRVVIVSGRAVSDLLPLLPLDPTPELWGSHGWERLRPDGGYLFYPLAAAAGGALRRAGARARGRWPGRCEFKPVSLAVHTRGMAEPEAAGLRKEVRVEWEEIGADNGLEIHDFDGGVELRAGGRDKGSVVRSLLEELDGAAVAYLGDDLTDEPAFKAIEGRGLSVLVRAELRQTNAALWLKPPGELLSFLSDWEHSC